MLRDTHRGEGGVKDDPKSADVVYGRPHRNRANGSLWNNEVFSL